MNIKILASALLNGVINGVINVVINGAIKWFSFSNEDMFPISVDSIPNNDLTVLGTVVTLSVSIAMILTLITFFL